MPWKIDDEDRERLIKEYHLAGGSELEQVVGEVLQLMVEIELVEGGVYAICDNG